MFSVGIIEIIILAAVALVVVVVITAILFGQAKNRGDK
jgi:Sec-independent protein translocase protein TatA